MFIFDRITMSKPIHLLNRMSYDITYVEDNSDIARRLLLPVTVIPEELDVKLNQYGNYGDWNDVYKNLDMNWFNIGLENVIEIIEIFDKEFKRAAVKAQLDLLRRNISVNARK